MGFCIFNNVAVAARHAMQSYGIGRVAIIDFDVHHGNGTEDIFENDPHVLMASTFQHPFYPYSGTESPASNMVNVPLPAGAGSKQFREAVTGSWLPALEEFQPELVIFSAGFDAHAEDDMAMLQLKDADYGWVTEQVKAVVQADTARAGTWTKPGTAKPGETLWEFFHHRDDRLHLREHLRVGDAAGDVVTVLEHEASTYAGEGIDCLLGGLYIVQGSQQGNQPDHENMCIRA